MADIENEKIRNILIYFYCRLSYHQRIRDMMPESYAELIPAVPEPVYKYTSEGASKSIDGCVGGRKLVTI